MPPLDTEPTISTEPVSGRPDGTEQREQPRRRPKSRVPSYLLDGRPLTDFEGSPLVFSVYGNRGSLDFGDTVQKLRGYGFERLSPAFRTGVTLFFPRRIPEPGESGYCELVRMIGEFSDVNVYGKGNGELFADDVRNYRRVQDISRREGWTDFLSRSLLPFQCP